MSFRASLQSAESTVMQNQLVPQALDEGETDSRAGASGHETVSLHAEVSASDIDGHNDRIFGVEFDSDSGLESETERQPVVITVDLTKGSPTKGILRRSPDFASVLSETDGASPLSQRMDQEIPLGQQAPKRSVRFHPDVPQEDTAKKTPLLPWASVSSDDESDPGVPIFTAAMLNGAGSPPPTPADKSPVISCVPPNLTP